MYFDYAFGSVVVFFGLMFFALLLDSIEEQHRQFRLSKNTLINPPRTHIPSLADRDREHQEFQEEHGEDRTERDEDPQHLIINRNHEYTLTLSFDGTFYQVWEDDSHSSWLIAYTQNMTDAIEIFETHWS